MYLGDLIKALEKMPQDLTVKHGFGNPHSWRGVYAELAFEPMDNVTVADMLRDADFALGNTFQGYKGGDFEMNECSEVHISFPGSSADLTFQMLLDSWTGA